MTPTTLTGSANTQVAYNVTLLSGPGYPLTFDTWIPVGRLRMNLTSYAPACLELTWNALSTTLIFTMVNGVPTQAILGSVSNLFVCGICHVYCCCPNCFAGPVNNCYGYYPPYYPNCETQCAATCGNSIGWATILEGPNCIGSVCGGPLPVELIEFNASKENNNSVSLRWKTASEIKNLGFEIQRGNFTDRNWETIGFEEGEGDSNELTSYVFIDKNPLFGINYYRLKQIDYDGNTEYSNVVSLDLKNKDKSFRISHTLVRDNLTFLFETESTFIRSGFISDMFGRKVMNINYKAERIDLNSLNNGQYIVSVQLNNGKIIPNKIIKIN